MSGKRKQVKKPEAKRTFRFVLGFIICLVSLAFSPRLADVSNIVRFTLLSAALLLITLTVWRRKIRISITLGTVLFGAFILFQAISIIWAPNKAEALFEVAKWITVFITFYLTHTLVRKHPVHFIVMMSRVSLVVFCISLVASLYQIIQLNDYTWNSRYAVTSLFSHKGTYAMMIILTMAFPLLRLRLKPRKGRTVYWIILVLQLSLLVFLQARSTWMAAVAIVLSLPILRLLTVCHFRYKWYCVIALTIIIGALVVGGSRYFSNMALPELDQSGGLSAKASIYERQALWRMTFRMIDGHPLIGCGTGNWKVCYPSVGTGDVFSINLLDYNFVRPHNDYLRILSESGYPGLFLILLVLSLLLTRSASTSARLRAGRVSHLSAAFVIGIMVFALFDFPIDRMEVLLWSTLLAATASGTAIGNHYFRSSARPYFQTTAAVLLFFITLLGISRWHSETYYRTIAHSIHNKQWVEVEQYSRKSRTPWYNLTVLGMPIAYYEAMALEYQHKPALETFRIALKTSPWCKQVLSDLGRLEYTEQHATSEAISLLREAIRISPGYTYAYLNLAQIYVHERRWQEALNVLDSLDLDKKEAELRQMTWHYHQGQQADYYTNKLVPIERKSVEGIYDFAQKQLDSF